MPIISRNVWTSRIIRQKVSNEHPHFYRRSLRLDSAVSVVSVRRFPRARLCLIWIPERGCRRVLLELMRSFMKIKGAHDFSLDFRVFRSVGSRVIQTKMLVSRVAIPTEHRTVQPGDVITLSPTPSAVSDSTISCRVRGYLIRHLFGECSPGSVRWECSLGVFSGSFLWECEGRCWKLH